MGQTSDKITVSNPNFPISQYFTNATQQTVTEYCGTKVNVDDIFQEKVDFDADPQNQIDGKQAKAITTTITIDTTDWSASQTCTKSVTGVTVDSTVFCYSSDSDVSCTAQGSGTLTFTAASSVPSTTTTIKVVIL